MDVNTSRLSWLFSLDSCFVKKICLYFITSMCKSLKAAKGFAFLKAALKAWFCQVHYGKSSFEAFIGNHLNVLILV